MYKCEIACKHCEIFQYTFYAFYVPMNPTAHVCQNSSPCRILLLLQTDYFPMGQIMFRSKSDYKSDNILLIGCGILVWFQNPEGSPPLPPSILNAAVLSRRQHHPPEHPRPRHPGVQTRCSASLQRCSGCRTLAPCLYLRCWQQACSPPACSPPAWPRSSCPRGVASSSPSPSCDRSPRAAAPRRAHSVTARRTAAAAVRHGTAVSVGRQPAAVRGPPYSAHVALLSQRADLHRQRLQLRVVVVLAQVLKVGLVEHIALLLLALPSVHHKHRALEAA